MALRDEDSRADNDSGLIHFVMVAAATAHDLTPAATLLHSDELVVCTDVGYQCIVKMREMAGMTTEYRMAIRLGKSWALPGTPDGKWQELIETTKAHICSKVDHPFRMIKQQFAFYKTWLRGLAKIRSKINALGAFANLFQSRWRLPAAG